MILANDDEEEESSNAETSQNSDSYGEEEKSIKKWSDRALMNKFGKMTAIGIEENESGKWIQKIRARCLLPHLL